MVSRPPGYLLDVAADAVDARRFAALLATAHESTDLRAKAALLGDALAQWRGPALADFVDADFTQPVVARLEELRLTALEDRAEVMLGPGELRHPALHVGRGAGAGTERGAGRVAPGDPGARPAAHAHAVPDHDGRPPADQPAGADDAADRPGRGDRARARPAGREQAGHAQRHRRHRRHRRRRQDQAGAGRRRRGHGPLPGRGVAGRAGHAGVAGRRGGGRGDRAGRAGRRDRRGAAGHVGHAVGGRVAHQAAAAGAGAGQLRARGR
ncbi:AfsR/SARP family transcriptional regulator [Saccharothrix longispora]|uniref:AfsR/SARP family transcriptional regulator n=1 Tax=Saccharothrix longispora TaxID=33920 RepID=UPI00398CF203